MQTARARPALHEIKNKSCVRNQCKIQVAQRGASTHSIGYGSPSSQLAVAYTNEVVVVAYEQESRTGVEYGLAYAAAATDLSSLFDGGHQHHPSYPPTG
jgi:hypothetical protein